MAMPEKYTKDDFLSQNRRDYNSNNFTIPKPIFTSQDIQHKRNHKLVLGTDDVTQERQKSEKQQQYRNYDKEEFKKKNDGSIFKLRNDSNLRKHHHDFDSLGLFKNDKPISNYNLNYQPRVQDGRQQNPFLNEDRLKTIEKMRKDNISLGPLINDPQTMKTESMIAYSKINGYNSPDKSVYNRIIQQRYNAPLVLGTDQIQYETSSKQTSPQIPKDTKLEPIQQNGIPLQKSNFELGQEGFQDYKKNAEGGDRQKEYIDQHKYSQEIYQRLQNHNRWDSIVLGEEMNNNYSSISKSQLPYHPTNRYLEAKNIITKQKNEKEVLQKSEIFGSDFNKDSYKSEKQDQYKPYENVRPNRLNPLRDQQLRYSSVKFDDVQVPEFTSINKSDYVSPNINRKEKSILDINLENSIKKVVKEDYIFNGKHREKWQTTNQQLLPPPGLNVPNSLGNKLMDLKMSHFQLG